MIAQAGGPTTITASGVVGVSGKPTIVYAINVVSGLTASKLILRNGSAATATDIFEFTGTASASVMVGGLPTGGILFPGGVYASVDANLTQATLWTEALETT